MEIGHEDWHVRASELCFVGHIVALYGLRNEALKFLDLIVFEVVESLLEYVLQLLLALLDKFARAVPLGVLLRTHNLNSVRIDLSIAEADLRLVDKKLDDVVTERVLAVIALEDSAFHLKLVVVKELFEEARLRVLVKLHTDLATLRIDQTSFALCVNHDCPALVRRAVLLLYHRV